MGVSHRPGFGLLGSVPRSLSTQPPFATQALKHLKTCAFDITAIYLNSANGDVIIFLMMTHRYFVI